MKRGQFTIIVIVAVVAILAIALLYLLRSTITEDQADQATQASLDAFTQNDAVRDYVRTCMQSIGEEAMHLAARQGGHIWQSQDGPSDRTATTTRGDTAYVITRDTTCHTLAPEDVPASTVLQRNTPAYPVIDLTIAELNASNLYERCPFSQHLPNSGYFGGRPTPALCIAGGPNNNTCQRQATASDNPVEHQLTNYSTSKLANCINTDRLEQLSGQAVTATGTPNVSIQFSDRDTTMTLDYPITASGDGTTTQYATFTYTFDARFKALYNFFNSVILDDLRKPTFNITDDYTSNSFHRTGFTMQRGTQDPTGDYTISASDTASTVAGESLTFTGVVENRPPILNHTPDTACGTFTVTAVDPDEDPLTLTYTNSTISGYITTTGTVTGHDGVVYINASDNQRIDWEEVDVC
jgi:hypothetical protein